jgi:exodeoxyribonuclease-3
MPFTLATWNINSVRLRADLVVKLLTEEAPDILCLQECKSPVDKIPAEVFAAAGYGHMVARGQKGYNGVAILSKLPLEDAGHRDFCEKGDARHVAARLENGTTIHNFYVPAGGDEPDREKNPKFGHKLDFLTEMRDWFRDTRPEKSILVGDLNIAPREDDVWSHKQLLKVVSHTPDRGGASGRHAGGGRLGRCHPRRYSRRSALQLVVLPREGLGRGGQGAQARSHLGLARYRQRRPWQPDPADARGWTQPSDHAPVFASFDL